MPANPEPTRFKPRTAEAAVVPPEPEAAASRMGLIGPSEAKELADIAELFGAGERASARPENTISAKAAAKAAMSAAAVAMEAAAVASARVVEEAAARAKREARGLDEVTPRSVVEAEALAMDLKAALDAASSSSTKAGRPSDVQAAVEADLAASKAAADTAAGDATKVEVRATRSSAAGGKKGKRSEDARGRSAEPAAAMGGLTIFVDDDLTLEGARSARGTARGQSADSVRSGASSARTDQSSARGKKGKSKGGKAKGVNNGVAPTDKENAAPQFDMRTLANAKKGLGGGTPKKGLGGAGGYSPRQSPRLSARAAASPMVSVAPRGVALRA